LNIPTDRSNSESRLISRLKSLELHGYKTFASRTNFEFPGSITTVVGPNGSGKSNIADAIRWVLGEQSYSLLRGRKTEDMIFAGSEMRPRASMASAMITFDNDDGWLPIDFSEVSIARRAYRDGQNEYILNGQRVRLKEISELLAQSGLAERTYTIIGQGLVDAALSLKPEERRRFFEEAAGIGLYRSRREESLNRLESTRRNLERVHDILNELQPRLRSLEKQAARAVEYERVKADLRVLLREWYGYHWHRTQQDLSRAREVLASQEIRLQQSRQKLQEVEARLKTQREELQQLRSELNNWHLSSADLHNQREKVSRNLAVLDERQRALNNQISLQQSDQTRLEEEEKIHRERVEIVRTERIAQEQAYIEAKKQAEAAQTILAEQQAARVKIEKVVHDLRRKMVASETRQVEQRAHRNELNRRRETLAKEKTRVEQALDGVNSAVDQARSLLVTAQDEQQRFEKEKLDLQNQLQTTLQNEADFEKQRKKLQDELSAKKDEIARAKIQLEVLDQAERNHSGLNQGTQTLMKAVQEGRISGSSKSVNTLFEVPVEFESAIAAGLGDLLEGITLDENSDPEKVLEMLEGSDKGRAVILPIAWLRRVPPLASPKDPDCLGVAANLVRSSASLEPVVNLLLGQVLVAKNRQTARRLAVEQPAHVRVVTLQGEVFFGNGIVSAGQEGRASLISRPRQIRELQSRLETLETDLQKILLEDEALAARIGQISRERQKLEQNLKDNDLHRNQAARAFQKATLELEQEHQKLDWQRTQIESLAEQISQTQTEIDNLENEEQKAGDEQESLALQIQEIEGDLDKLPLDEFQVQLVHWNTQEAINERVLKESGHREQEHQQALQSNLAQQELLRGRHQHASEHLAQLEVEKQNFREQENTLNSEIDTLRKQIEPAESRLTGMESHYERILDDQTAAQQNLSVSDRHATQAQLEMTRIRESLDHLRRRIEEDFGLVAFEYQVDISGPTPLPFEGMVEQLPTLVELPTDLEENINQQRTQLRRMGAIYPEAQQEYQSVKERFEFLSAQVVDLKKADEDLREVIAELDALMKKEFRKTFDAVAAEFKVNFTRLFGGGSARLILHDEDNPTETGIDIEARLPGRREQGLSLLSGGERSLTAVALIFSLLKVSPTPFCVLDEVDAMLDEANVGRFCELLLELSENTQFIIITHNRNTVQVADVIYGVTMGKDTSSQVISLKLDEVTEDLVK
jgi:chromosome segregation protein